MTVTDQLSFSKNALKKYTQEIDKLYNSGLANEESFYPDFKVLLKNFFKSEEYDVIVASRRERNEGKPDITVYMNRIPIINVEGKNPGDWIDEWLKKESKNRLYEQVYRYRGGKSANIPVIITDFLRIWIVDKDIPNSLESDIKIKNKFNIVDDTEEIWKPFRNAKENIENALHYAAEEISFSITKVSSLIPHLVKYAKKLKDKILDVFKYPKNPMKIYLEGIRDDFINSIFSSDKEQKSEEFADLYAQTIIYGGFLAWMRFCKDGNSSKDFNFNIATKYLPYGTFTFSLFTDISTKSSPEIKNKIINKIERIFQLSEFKKITENTETLMITFYSDFLWQYSPKIAKDRGIVFTPHPIINFIVRGIDHFLKNEFNVSDGIISSKVNFLDPAAGTMGFPCEIIRLAKNNFQKKFDKQPGRIISEFDTWVHNCFLNNTYAFEILMAPYVLGHLRTNMLLDELGAKVDSSKDKINLLLFNTLMDLQTTLKDFRNPAIGQEIVEALNIRNNKRILVVLSNPPYNVSSQNKFKWIDDKVDFEVKKTKNNTEADIIKVKKDVNDYIWDLQREGTKELQNIKALHDDYVKFIRFAQWKIKQHGYGIVAFITNNYYIDGLIFRGMRSSLRRDFDEIWILNLYGNARKGIPFSIKEQGINKDENVFGIKVGVAIVFFIRNLDHNDEKCKIEYKGIFGTKPEKFAFLSKSINDINFESIAKRQDYEFCPDEFKKRAQYEKFPYLLDIFEKHIVGIITKHDSFVSDVDKEVLIKKLKAFFNGETGINLGLANIQKSNYWWKPKKVMKKTDLTQSIKNIILWNYRGFDKRYFCYNNYLNARNSYHLLQYLIPPNNNNITLIVNRQSVGCKGDSSIFISNTPFEVKCCEGAKGLGSYAFPLKINNSNKPNNFQKPKNANLSNIKQDFINILEYGSEIDYKEIFYYIYGCLYTPTFRQRYYIGLREDFPRIPFPKRKDIFITMSNFGKKLIDLHLLRDKSIESTKFQMSPLSDYKIYYIRSKDKSDIGNQIPDTYDPSTQKIYFKKRTQTQIKEEIEGKELKDITWIGGITQEMWDFEIGGRQQLKEWLYSRTYSNQSKKNTVQRALNNKELDYFLKMCDAIKKTIELLPKLDEIYKKIDP